MQRLRGAAGLAAAAAAAASDVAKHSAASDALALAELRRVHARLAEVRARLTWRLCVSPNGRTCRGILCHGELPSSCTRARLTERCAGAERERGEARTACLAAGAREQELLQENQQLSQGAVELEHGLSAHSEELMVRT